MEKNQSKKYEVNSFIVNSRLVKSLPVNQYSLAPNQVADIKCQKWSFIILSMNYHIKFPRYINNKLSEINGKCDQSRLIVIVTIENESESLRYGEVQMICLQRNVKNIPCFTIQEARSVLEDMFYSQK